MKLLAIDGNSILNRAFYGIKALTTKNGEFTNGIYGFLNLLLRLREEVRPDAVACAFDLREPTFRHKMYDGYKGNRKGMPDELAGQLAPLKELLGALGYPVVTCPGYEADDILGTLSKACADRGDECVIATGDRDSLQLVGPRVSVRLATTKMGQPVSTLYDEAAVREKYGVPPCDLVDMKAIMGDSSDCIPGVPGMGEKGASALIAKYHNLEAIYRDLEALEATPSVRKKLAEGKDLAFLSRELARIDCAAPIDRDPESYRPGPVDADKAAALFARYELFSLQKRWGVEPSARPQAPRAEEAAPLPPPALKALTAEEIPGLLSAGDRFDLVAPQLPKGAVRAGDALYLFDGEAAVSALMAGAGKLRVWSGKPLYKLGAEGGPTAAFDGELAAYLLSPNSSSYQIKDLAAQYGVTPPSPPPDIPEGYAETVADALLAGPLFDRLEAEIREKGQEKLLYEIELPLAQVLASMEKLGFTLDSGALEEYGVELRERIEELEAAIYEDAGRRFNINSPKQLGAVLFEELGLPAKKKTKTGYSTNAEVLDGLRGLHPIIDRILSYRQLSKLKSTYVDGLLGQVDADGRVRSSFIQTETRTGRISSAEPNLQNIPVRTQEGARLRRFFVARPGWVLVDADYSQIELRVLAHIAGDETMIRAFQNGEDIHRTTAAQVFDMPPELVTPRMRSSAKAVNFGIVYGIGAFSLSQDIGVTVAEADEYIKNYLENFSGVKKYMEETVAAAKEDGYVTTMFGRRRYLPELAATNRVTRAFGERVARNTPIQGTAADIIKIAMVRVCRRLLREGLRARLILQVHDELLVEAPEGEADRVTALLREEMENAVALRAPLRADTNAGKNWLEAK